MNSEIKTNSESIIPFQSLFGAEENLSTTLPQLVSLESFRADPPALPEELISGVLRCGHKMLVSGPSKAGKSFLLMELCIALAEGKSWLGFKCRKSKVLYVNLEIDSPSCINRFLKIYEALGWEPENLNNIMVWNLRGHALPLDGLVPVLVERMRNQNFNAVIVDPIYKVITGDENSASEMGFFCNQFDKICSQTGCSVIYCHHHSKGFQGAKRAIDRASGSGVFARDPDAQLDLIELDIPDEIRGSMPDSATAWRMEGSLREFESFKPRNFWFVHPVHKPDQSGALSSCPANGSIQAARLKNRKFTTSDQRRASVINAYNACKTSDAPVTIEEMAKSAGVTVRCMRDRLKEAEDIFKTKKGKVWKSDENEQ